MSLHHPIDFSGKLAKGWLFLHRCPADNVRDLLPPGLELIEHQGHAFWNVVASRVEHLRPTALEAAPWDGLAFWQIAYRLMVRHGKTEGLYFVRSDCDNLWVTLGGNWCTDFHFQSATVTCQQDERWAYLRVNAKEDWAEAWLDAELPPRRAKGSPFASLAEAADFLTYRPVALNALADGTGRVVRVQRSEQRWQPQLRQVVDQRWPFLEPYEASPELCWELPRVPYQWKKAELLPPASQPKGRTIQEPVHRPEPEQVLAIRSVPT